MAGEAAAASAAEGGAAADSNIEAAVAAVREHPGAELLTLPNSSDPHRSVITIPSGLYGLDALETEINHQIRARTSRQP